MAQTGYTPILIYGSSTGGNAPAAASLTNSTLGSELAINIADGKLFYKDSGGSVQVIAWKTTPTSAGGTGLTSYTAGDTLYYATGTTLSKLAIGASKTIMTSSGTAPQWSASLDTSQGGTGVTSYTAGDLPYYASGTALSKLAIGANTYILSSNGSAPQWVAPSSVSIGTATNLAGGAGGSVPYQSAAGTTAMLAIGTAYYQLGVNAGGTAPAWQPSATSVLTAQGDLLYASAANTLARLAKNTTATRYLANTGTSNNPSWDQINLANGVTGTLGTANGGTGLTSFTANSILYASSTSALANSNLYSDGTNGGLNNSAPYAWTTGNALTIGTKAAFANDSNYGSIVASNVYYNAGWKIATTGSVAGGLLAVGNYGRLYFYGTSSGTAGNAATLTQYMFIDGFNSGTTTFGPTSGTAQDMSVNISNTNVYSYLNFQRNGTTFANILGYYGQGFYYNADYHYFRKYDGTVLATIDINGNLYGNVSATNMTNGFVYIPAAGGAPSGTPTAVSGHVPMYYDTTNNKFYVYNGAWKSVALT